MNKRKKPPKFRAPISMNTSADTSRILPSHHASVSPELIFFHSIATIHPSDTICQSRTKHSPLVNAIITKSIATRFKKKRLMAAGWEHQTPDLPLQHSQTPLLLISAPGIRKGQFGKINSKSTSCNPVKNLRQKINLKILNTTYLRLYRNE